MRKNRPFAQLFSFYFITITTLMVLLFIGIGLHLLNRFIAEYVDKFHAETQTTLSMKALSYYEVHHNWNGYNGGETGEAAKLTGDYFTVLDQYDNAIYTTEDERQRCCDNKNHIYTRTEIPLMVNGEQVGTLIAGYFTNHVTSPEAGALRKSGRILVILCLLSITLTGTIVSLLFFYRLSKPVKEIARVAKDISHGHLRNQIALQSNISEMNEIAEAINTLGNSLLNQEKFRKQLTTELSHELRTPLQILLNQVEAILDGIHEADTKRLESMHGEIERITRLLNELEDRLMYENENFDIDLVYTNASELIRKVVVGYEGSFSKKGLEFSWHIEPNIMLNMDATRIAQVVVNILSNALKYTDEGSVKLWFQYKNGLGELVVKDTGRGMGNDTLQTLYGTPSLAFKSVHSKGVGLHIVKIILQKHGWQFNLSSQPDKGTTVTITAPFN